MQNRVTVWLHRLYRIEAACATLAYVAVASLLLGDIICREIFGFAIWGAQKIAVFGAIIAAFIGLVLATADDSHLKQDVLARLLPSAIKQYIGRVSGLVAAILHLTLALLALQFVSQSYSYGDQAAVLYIPLWPMQLILPYAFFSSALRHLAFMLYPQLRPQTTAGNN